MALVSNPGQHLEDGVVLVGLPPRILHFFNVLGLIDEHRPLGAPKRRMSIE